ncbi:MAG: gamma-glutamyltransferase [Planctomycetes bacterium]|nr:gamma-glutamyltransferase [Planctomycetota bacterium]
MRRPLSRVLVLLSLSGVPLLHAGDRITGKPFATRSEVLAKNGMVATSQPLATTAALEILRAGGSAVDAAIAANAVQCLTEPVGCGLGGDLFALVWESKTRRLHGLNASGRSPRGLTLDKLRELGVKKIPALGPLPVSVPGCVDGWFELHARFGKLPMSAVLAPAIRYAREGFPVAELVAHYWALSVPRLKQFPGFLEQFTLDGRAPEKGELFANPNLARTLELLAAKGRDEFYRGSIAREIDAYMKANGGYLAYEDLAEHRSEWVEPISVDYRGYRVWELPPNGQGITALEMLNILEGYDLSKLGFGSAEHLHLLTEAKKLAFEDRARFIADPDFAKLPVAGLLSDEYAATQRARIDRSKAAASYAPGNPALDEGDTIYLCAADADGNMVSLIQSNYRGMGSGMTPGALGFILQDRGEMFDLDPASANVYAPGKRPFHTIIPAFVTRDGEPFLCFGVMGGATQPQGHVQILLNLIDFGMNFQEAGDAPRMVHNGSSEPTGERMSNGGKLCLESGFDPAVVKELERRGHVLGKAVGDFGGYQGIGFDPKTRVYFGASESRKDGMAAGY